MRLWSEGSIQWVAPDHPHRTAVAGMLGMSPDKNDFEDQVNATAEAIRAAVAALGGPVFVNIAP